MIVEVANFSKMKISEKKIHSWITFFEKKLPKLKNKKTKTLTVALVPESRIRRLNKMFRKKDKPTDVLSFSGTYSQHFGDLVICPQVIKKQAKEHGLTFDLELAYMILHGLLHLLGYEHENSAKKAKIMFALQDKIFQLLSNHEFKYRTK